MATDKPIDVDSKNSPKKTESSEQPAKITAGASVENVDKATAENIDEGSKKIVEASAQNYESFATAKIEPLVHTTRDLKEVKIFRTKF